ncbi:hypothetical protein P3342_011068 [Pyrenophora teres f. teres]|nr:hypothetical protein P3342_011068 [Pyrenophora teres f. teres]
MVSSPPIKLAVLDDYHNIAARHFAHIDRSKLSVTVFNDTLPSYSHPETTDASRSALVARLQPFTVLSTMRERTPFPAALLRRLPNLKVVLGTGGKFESWDLDTMRLMGIKVCAAPGKGRTDGKGSAQSPRSLPVKQGGGHPTTQHVWALILGLARNIAADDAVVKGKGRPAGWQTELAMGLQGKTLGLVGLGRIGAHVARVAVLAFGMKVICWITKKELFSTSDVVSINYVLSSRSLGIIGAPELNAMKPSALLINTSRGPLIDEAALLDTLRKGRIRGAAIDVFDIEPLPADSPWRTENWETKGKSRVLLTPHMGYVEEGTMTAWYEETAENVERLVEGKELLHRIV